MASASNQNGDDLEIESQFILRMPSVRDKLTGEVKPHPAAVALREALSKLTPTSNEEVLKDRLFIDINTDTRKGRLKFDKDTFEARLVDLPCVIESLKTYDKKSFYKVADICQMLVCLPPGEKWPNSSSSEDEGNTEASGAKKKKTKEAINKKYKWSHGIAPPLKNVRHKRFRKMPKKQIENYAEVQRYVKKLFRADRDASKVEYEELYDYVDENNENEANVDEEEDDEDDECTKTNIYDDDDEDEENEDEYSSQFEDTSLSKSASGRGRGRKKLNETSTSQYKIKKSAKSKRMVEHSNPTMNDESMTNLKMDNTSSDNLKNHEETTMKSPNEKFDALMNEETNQSNMSDGKSAGVVKQIFGDISSSSDDEEDFKDQAADSMNFSSTNFNLDMKYVHFSGSVTKSKKGSSGEQRKIHSPDKDDSNSMFAMEAESILLGEQEKADDDEESDEETVPLEFGASSFSKIKFNMDSNEEEAVSKKEADLRAHQSTIDEILNLSLSSGDNEDVDGGDGGDDIGIGGGEEYDESSDKNSTLAELQEKLNVLTSELEKISEDRKKREVEILSIKNPTLKNVLMSKMNNLIEEESKKAGEIEAIQDQIQQLKN